VLELERREGRVQASALGEVGVRDDPADQLIPIDQGIDRATGCPQDLAAEGVERAHPHGPGGHIQRREGGRQTAMVDEYLAWASDQPDLRDTYEEAQTRMTELGVLRTARGSS
jgi:hypothetical protein